MKARFSKELKTMALVGGLVMTMTAPLALARPVFADDDGGSQVQVEAGGDSAAAGTPGAEASADSSAQVQVEAGGDSAAAGTPGAEASADSSVPDNSGVYTDPSDSILNSDSSSSVFSSDSFRSALNSAMSAFNPDSFRSTVDSAIKAFPQLKEAWDKANSGTDFAKNVWDALHGQGNAWNLGNSAVETFGHETPDEETLRHATDAFMKAIPSPAEGIKSIGEAVKSFIKSTGIDSSGPEDERSAGSRGRGTAIPAR